jgi:hypothetical protein
VNRRPPTEGPQREGVSRAANDEWNEELAEGLGVERVQLDLRSEDERAPYGA